MTLIAQSQMSVLTRAQRYALGKVAMRTLNGQKTTATQYPKYTADFAMLEEARLIEITPAGSYALTPNGAREIQSWPLSARPVRHSTLQEYIRDYNNALIYGGDL